MKAHPTMLGSEYNWLISPTRPVNGVPKVRISGRATLLTLAVALFCLACVALRAEPPHLSLLREAAVAAQAGDNAQLIAKLEAARALRPDYPRVLHGLARAYAAAGRTDDAVAVFRELGAMGLALDLAKLDAPAALREHPDFAALAKTFSTNQAAAGHDEAAWAIPDADGILEGLACHPTTLTWYFSDVRNRCIWTRDGSGGEGRLKKFSRGSDGLLGVFALKIDAVRGKLWASSSALPEMKGSTADDKGRAFLAEYDLATSRLLRTYPAPTDGRDHVLGDFVLASDGSVFATDSTSPIIWRLAPGGTALEKWLEHDHFLSLQGIAFGADGRALFVSDYANGLWRIDPATRSVALLRAPAHTTLFGIDGVYAVPGGLIAVQNGVNPQRIVRIALGGAGQPAKIDILLSGHAALTDATLGQVVNGRFHFIANSGWSLYETPTATPAPRAVTILTTPL